MGETCRTESWTDAMYAELRVVARRSLKRERPGHTLQTTALVHEAYLRLSTQSPETVPPRTVFLAAASQVMRQILIDHARKRLRVKRGGDLLRITLDELQMTMRRPDEVDVLAVHEALDRLGQLDPRQARIVEMRFFGGMSIEEVADALQIATKTVDRDWSMARAWLRRELDPVQDR